jgi:hypothetical protein
MSLDYARGMSEAGTTTAAAAPCRGDRLQIDLGLGGRIPGGVRLIDGWSDTLPDGLPALGHASVLELASPTAAESCVLSLDLSPFAPPLSRSAQRVIVVVNGEVLREAVVAARQVVHCRVKQSTLRAANRLTVMLLHPQAASLASAARPLDDRRFSTVLHRLTITPLSVHSAIPGAAPVPPDHPMAERPTVALHAPDLWLPPDIGLRQITTHWGTVLFADASQGALRHGPAASSPRNVMLAERNGTGILFHLADGGARYTIRLAPAGPPDGAPPDDAGMRCQTFRLVHTAPDAASPFGLRSQGLLVSAEADGNVTLSRTVLGPWERFRLTAPAEPPAPPRQSPERERSAEQQRNARLFQHLSSGAERDLPVSFYPQARVELDDRGVPGVTGVPSTDLAAGADVAGHAGDLTIVVRDPTYIDRYFHFMEILIGCFAFHMQHLPACRVVRIIFGSQPWKGPPRNNVQATLIEAVYGDIETIEDRSPLYGGPSLRNVLVIDRARARSRLNKFLESLLPEAQLWMPELRRRVHAATQAPQREAPRRADEVRCSCVARMPPRTLAESVKSRLLQLLNDRFGSVAEFDFGGLPWSEQVRHAAGLDLLAGVHGNGLTNLLWLPPHAAVIEFFPPGARRYDYQMMAEIAGVSYFGFEPSDHGHVFRDWTRGGPVSGDINQPIETLPEAALFHALNVIEMKFSTGMR